MLAFAPQAWTSDDTDAIERLRIQWGTSLAYPLSSMGAHVSAVPNHQVGRVTPLATRAAVAFFGVFGYELDPTAPDAGRAGRDRRPGRASTPATARSSSAAGSCASRARSRATATRSPGWPWRRTVDARSSAYYQILSRPDPGPVRLRLRGLDPAAIYRVTPLAGRTDDPVVRPNRAASGPAPS